MAAAIVGLRAVGGRRHFASSYSSPCLMLPPDKMYSLRDKKVVNINTEKEFESDIGLGSSHGWMARMCLSKDCCSLSLWNPMSGSRLKLPPIIPHYHPKWGLSVPMRKLVVDDAECSRAVMMSPSSTTLGVCCPDECSEWTLFGPDKDSYRHSYTSYYDVVACSQHRVYSLDEYEGSHNLVRWDISDPRKPRIESEKGLYGHIYEDDFPHSGRLDGRRIDVRHQQLVYAEHSGQMFIVTGHLGADKDWWNSGIYPIKTIGFHVHLLVEIENENENCQVRYMEHSLDGLVMFVGTNSGFAVAAADFPHLKPDSIYFTNSFGWDDADYVGYDVGIYDYKNRTISSCYYPAGYHQPPNRARHQPPNRARPQPSWLTPTSTSKR